MPKMEEIISGLQAIVNNYSTLAIIWHAILYLLLAAMIFFWQPSNKTLAILISIPVLSVAILAWLSGNPFNGILFMILAVLTIIFGLKASGDTVTASRVPFVAIGIFMICFGLVYPHFINGSSFVKYLYMSPVGLIPCPTLSLIIGILLLYNGLSSQPLTLTFIVFGLFYGIFGTFKLGVYIDSFLVFGTLSLLLKYIIALKA